MPKINATSLFAGSKFLEFYQRQRGLSRAIQNDPRARRDVQPRFTSEDTTSPVAISPEGGVGVDPMRNIPRPGDAADHATLLAAFQALYDQMAEKGYLE